MTIEKSKWQNRFTSFAPKVVVTDGAWTATIIVLPNYFLDGIDLSPPRLLLWPKTPIYFNFLPFPIIEHLL